MPLFFYGLAFLAKIPPFRLFQLFVDGKKHNEENGTEGFNRREPGCTRQFYEALLYALEYVKDKPVDLTLIFEIHSIITENIGGELTNVERGKFRTIPLVSFQIPQARATSSGIFDIVRDLQTSWGSHAKLSYKGHIIPLNYNLSTREANHIYENTACLNYTPPNISQMEIQQFAENILAEYYLNLKKARNRDEQLLAIAKCIRKFELLHPFVDANGRTFVNVLLNVFLLQNGFPPATFYEPNIFDLYSNEELVEAIKEAMYFTLYTIQNPNKPLFGFHAERLPAQEKEIQLSYQQKINEVIPLTPEMLPQQYFEDLLSYCQSSWAGMVTLQQACVLGDETFVENLKDPSVIIKPGPLWASPLYKGTTAIHLACLMQQIPVVKRLLSLLPACINKQDNYGNTPMHYAVRANNGELIDLLLANHPDLSLQNGKGEPISPWIVRYSDPVCFNKLIPADNVKSQLPRLILASIVAGNFKLFLHFSTFEQGKALLKENSSLYFIEAAKYQNLEIFKSLSQEVKKGTLFSFDEFYSFLPSVWNSCGFFNFIYQQTDFSTKNVTIAYDFFAKSLQLFSLKKHHPTFLALLAIETNLKSIQAKGNTLLHLTVLCKNATAAAAVLATDIDVNQLNEDGFSALHLAVINHSTEIIQTLCQSQKIAIDVETKPVQNNYFFPIKEDSKTPLMLAIETENIIAVTILLEFGAKVDNFVMACLRKNTPQTKEIHNLLLPKYSHNPKKFKPE